MERAGFEPAPSGLQTHLIAQLHLTPTDRIGMTEPKSAVPPNAARHRSTAVRSHLARTAAAYMGNIRAANAHLGVGIIAAAVLADARSTTAGVPSDRPARESAPFCAFILRSAGRHLAPSR
jgi:hypothetical protein